MQLFFLELLSNFVSYLSYSVYEEVFPVFDKLLYLSSDVLTEHVIKKCTVGLVDKYTLKSKAHKNSVSNFMKIIMDMKLRNPKVASPAHRRGESLGQNELDESLNDNELSIQQRNHYFEIMTDFCFFTNRDCSSKSGKADEEALRSELA